MLYIGFWKLIEGIGVYVMIGETEQLINMNFDWKSGIIVFLLIVVLLPKWGQAWKALCDFIGYEPKSLRKEREQKEKTKKLFEKQEEYHQQSIRIRDGLEKNQQKLDKNQQNLEMHQEEMKQDLSEIRTSLSCIQKMLLKNTIETKRKNILDFCATLSNKQKQNKEAFNEIFRTYEDYEKILKDNDMENGQTEESMKFISEIYQQMLRDGDLI